MGAKQRPSVKRLRRERIARERLQHMMFPDLDRDYIGPVREFLKSEYVPMEDKVHYVDATKKLAEIARQFEEAKAKVAPRARPNGFHELQHGVYTRPGDIVYRDGSWQDTDGERVDGLHVFLRPDDDDNNMVGPRPPADTGLGMDDFLRF